MQRIYDDLGIRIELGCGPDTTDDLVSFALTGTGERVDIVNSLRHQPDGIRACATTLGIKPSGKPDFTVITLPQPGGAAAVMSQNRCPSYSVLRNRECMADGTLQAIAVGSGNANVFTPNGMRDLLRIAELLEAEFGIAAEHTLISQTGAIGAPLPMQCFESGISHLANKLQAQHLDAASEAMLTTDSGPKVASVAVGDFVLTGIAKGAGMVEPNMATMLVYFFTNAQADASFLQDALEGAVDVSFNRLSIDAATSTSDTVALVSTGAHALSSTQQEQFRQALTAMSVKLTRDIASQGEGVSKTLEVTVDSDVSLTYSQRVAKQIINSPLVKTSAHGAIPGWGRIVAAIGKPQSGHADPMLAPEQVEIALQSHTVYQRGQAITPDLQALNIALRRDKVMDIHVTLGAGGYLGRAWGCDLSVDYVQFNASA
ncbi:MAG: bifunctional ornithine acetyltransferase/N-acetylglutamate synthase [Candidatus Tectomicrobia bacterium]|nr:bifunctional ornithine acetyltransferase/N-acetylglutamate synthase [Candidatus Tectomicrobia bacterium]